MQLIKDKQDLTYLSWSVYRNSFGIVVFLKAYLEISGKRLITNCQILIGHMSLSAMKV